MRRRSGTLIVDRVAEIFQTQCWIRYALMTLNLDIGEFAKLAIDHESNLSVATAWYEGKYPVKKYSVDKINQKFPGASDVYYLPMFKLMTSFITSEKEVHKIMTPYIHVRHDGYRFWAFPTPNSLQLNTATRWRTDNNNLIEAFIYRADIHAFTALFALYKLAQAWKDGRAMFALLQALYRILPAIVRLPWILPLKDQFLSEIRTLRDMTEWIGPGFEVDKNVFDYLSSCWHEQQDDYFPHWQKIKWNSGPNDPVVVYDRTLRRRFDGCRPTIETTHQYGRRLIPSSQKGKIQIPYPGINPDYRFGLLR